MMITQLVRGLFRRSPSTISADDAHTAIAKRPGPGQPSVLLDVRENHEWEAGHAPGAVHVPLGELSARLETLPHDRQIITVCRSGRRSALAAQQLGRHGYTVVNLGGGMTAWAAAGLPVVTVGGTTTGRVA